MALRAGPLSGRRVRTRAAALLVRRLVSWARHWVGVRAAALPGMRVVLRTAR
ncbi:MULTISPECIES: hypothetical protein [Actinosynnema]|uniref:hypothetical protein n=1 Tax=Actinosynnema TaxID=40566 RepID=UPI0020A3A481|nr:hypothetical protein [Actinosynnema pretiosum]